MCIAFLLQLISFNSCTLAVCKARLQSIATQGLCFCRMLEDSVAILDRTDQRGGEAGHRNKTKHPGSFSK